MKKFHLNPLVLAMAITALPATVYAQENNDNSGEAVEEVVVTGSFRDSLQNAQNIKRNSSGFVDAIVAEDIAEFPDNNLAESLQRIPGVAISRSGGEGRQISVRGLGPNFTRVRINGMESIATTGGTDATGGTNRGRGFDFNTFSSDLFSNLTVSKTATAETDEGSLGATVDLRAARPFDFGDRVIKANVQAGYNEESEETDPAVSFMYSDTSENDMFGWLVSVSHSERSIRDVGNSTVRWSTAESFGQYDGAAIDGDHELNTAYHPRIPRYDVYNHELERSGASLSLQFRPTDATEISLDGLWAKHDATREEIFMQASLNGNAQVAAINVLDYEIEGNTIVYADTENARLLSENRFDKMSTDFSQVTLSVDHEFTDSLRLNFMYGTSKSDFEIPIQNTLLMRANGQDFSWDYRGGADDVVLTFGEEAYEPGSWVTESVRQRPQGTLNEYDNGQISLEYDLSESITLKAGIVKKEFDMSTYQDAYAGGEGVSCALNPLPDAGCGVDIQAQDNFIVEYNSGFGRNWLIPNRAAIMDAYNLFDLPMEVNRGSTYQVGEETLSAYIQADFDFDFGGVRVGGNIGVRHFETDQDSSAWKGLDHDNDPDTAVVWEQGSVSHKYDDLLPAVNLFVEPIEDLKIRAAYSEGIARAGLGSLVSNTNVNVAGTSRTVTAGNPLLEPTKAKSYDLGVEWYFSEGAMLSAAIFQKDIESHVQTIREQKTYASTGLPLDLAVQACNGSLGYNENCNENLEWDVSQPVNGPGGDLDGYEVSYSQPFTFLPGIWANFGVIAAYTRVESEMDYLNSDGTVANTTSLIDLSPKTSSATVYYEDDVFSGRVAVAKRSGYLTNAVFQNGNYQGGTNATTNVDASFSYQINDNLKLTLEALNLTDEADDQWVDSADDRVSYYHTTGRQYYLGVGYKF